MSGSRRTLCFGHIATRDRTTARRDKRSILHSTCRAPTRYQLTRRWLSLALISLATCLGPLGLGEAANAQQTVPPRHIGVLLAARLPQAKELQAFRRGLLDAGYSEGHDLSIDWRFASGDYARVPELVAELVQRKVEVIVVDTTIATQAVKRATSTIPFVMTSIADPVGSGLVASLAHPGGNITGLSLMMPDLSAKQFAIAKGDGPRSYPGGSPMESKHAVQPEDDRIAQGRGAFAVC